MKRVLTFMSVTLLLLGIAGFALSHGAGLRLMSVQGSSMAPALRQGDLLVVERRQFKHLRVGDAVSYRNLLQPNVIITHRVLAINLKRQILVAKGDNTADLENVPIASVVGVARNVIPYFGQVFNFLRTIAGLTIFCYLPALALVLSEVQLYDQGHRQSVYQSGYRVTG